MSVAALRRQMKGWWPGGKGGADDARRAVAPYDLALAGFMAIVVSLFVISIPICVWLCRLPGGGIDNRLLKILLLAFVLKSACVLPRYAVNEYLYKGETDAGQYDNAGAHFVDNLHHGKFWSLEGSTVNSFNGETRAVGYLAGVLYTVFGTTYMGGYITFTWLSWLGVVFAFQAFRVAYPNAPPYFAAKILFFLPSMLYWPSSLGKDAVMVFSLGLLTLGVARLLTPSRPLRAWPRCASPTWRCTRRSTRPRRGCGTR